MIRTISLTISRVGRFAGLRLLLLAGLVAMCADVAHAQWTTNGNDIYSSNSGNVGVGTSSPGYKLEVNGAATINSGLLRVMAPSNSAASGLSVGYSDNLLLWQDGTNGVVNASYGDLYLRPMDSTKAVNLDTGIVYVANALGIGTSNPSSELHVVGDVTVTGNISAVYQDLAEWVPSRHPLVAGTVVIVDSDGRNTVLPSNQSYDTRVAGVVSAMPGIILGEQGEGKVKVATTGRVKVRVDASQGPVRPGDLLVTSGKEGVAMRSEPMDIGGRKFHQPGTLIGKALEPLNEGEGEILVLLSLQ